MFSQKINRRNYNPLSCIQNRSAICQIQKGSCALAGLGQAAEKTGWYLSGAVNEKKGEPLKNAAAPCVVLPL